VIACIPASVINGVFLVVCQILVANGFKIVQKETISARNSIIMGLSVAITVGSMSISSDVISQFPVIIQYFVSSGTAVGAFTAVLLNLLLPKIRIDNVKEEVISNETV
jgi:xanthine/uracil permease